MKKRIVTIVLLVVLTLGAFTTMAMARTELTKQPGQTVVVLREAAVGQTLQGKIAAVGVGQIASATLQEGRLGNYIGPWTQFNDFLYRIFGVRCDGSNISL